MKKYNGLNSNNADVIVEFNKDFPSYPFTIKGVCSWGVSDGTLSKENPFSNNPEYKLTEQHGGANVYRKIR